MHFGAGVLTGITNTTHQKEDYRNSIELSRKMESSCRDGRYIGIDDIDGITGLNTSCFINYIFCGLEVARKP